MAKPLICIATALLCEARPLIEHYRLKRCLAETAFQTYQGSQVMLLVSGVGKTAMAAAVAYGQGLTRYETERVWLNLGIAGHRDLPVGTPRLVHQIRDQESGRQWFPPLVLRSPCRSETLVTVSQPQLDYPEPVLYDMEASAFFATAIRFVTSELVQSVKIVSDNAGHGPDQLDQGQVTELVAASLTTVTDAIEALLDLQSQAAPVPGVHLTELAGKCYLTSQQRRQADKLLRRWQALAPETLPSEGQWPRFEEASQLLQWLRRRVEQLPVRLG